MTIRIVQEPPVIAECFGNAANMQDSSAGMTRAASKDSVSSQATTPSFSSRSTCDTCAVGMDMEACLRKIEYLETEAEKRRKREQKLVQQLHVARACIDREHDLMQQLHDAKACIVDKGKEVCSLQGQILEGLRERQELARKVLERDCEILRLQELLAIPQTRELDVADQCSVSETAAESRYVGSSHVAADVRLMPASDSRINPFEDACGSIEQFDTSGTPVRTFAAPPSTHGVSTLPEENRTFSFSEEQPPQNGAHGIVGPAPCSPPVFVRDTLPNLSKSLPSLPPQLKFHEMEVPSWAQRRKNLQIQKTSRPFSHQ